MSEQLYTSSQRNPVNFQRLSKELVREVRECAPSDYKHPYEVERSLDANQQGHYPMLFMGIQSEEGVHEIEVLDIEKPLHAFGHIHEAHISKDGIPSVFYILTLEGLVIRRYPHEGVLDDIEVGLLADKLAASS